MRSTGIWLLQDRSRSGAPSCCRTFHRKPDALGAHAHRRPRAHQALRPSSCAWVEAAAGIAAASRGAFEVYRSGEWRAVRPAGRLAEKADDRWTLRGPIARRLTVRRSFPAVKACCRCPPHARVESLPAQSSRCSTGTVRVRGSPRFVAFTAAYEQRASATRPRHAPTSTWQRTFPDARAHHRGNNLLQPTPALTVEAVLTFSTRTSPTRSTWRAYTHAGDFLARDRKGHASTSPLRR